MATIRQATKPVLPDYSRRWRVRYYSIGGLAIACILIALLALTVGSVRIPFTTVWSIILSHLPFVNLSGDWSSTTDMIITGIRLPRIMMAGVVGAALGVAGATYQGLFRNPLADPYLIGVAQGAALGAAVGFLLSWTLLGLLPHSGTGFHRSASGGIRSLSDRPGR